MPYRFCLAFSLFMLSMSLQAAEHTIHVGNVFFDPAELTIQVGDSVTWVNDQGFHNVAADDDSFRCADGCAGEGGDGNPAFPPWEFTRTFTEVGEVRYHCQPHRDDGQVGVINVVARDDLANIGHTGSWYNPDTDGQGFIIEVLPEVPGAEGPQMVVYWFTYAPGEPGGVNRQRWFQATGPVGDPTSELDVISVTQGVFDAPDPVSVRDAGTIGVTFASCTEGTIEYDLDLDGNGSNETTGEIPIDRLSPDVQCQELTGG